MNKKNNRLLLATAILLALGAGFGLARLMGTPGPDSTDQHAQADDHSDEGEGDGHAGGPEGEGAEEGVIALTPEQIKASGIDVVAVGRGGGHETRLSGRVEPAVGARASIAAAIGGRVERVLVAPGSSIKAGEPLVVVVSGEAATLRASADAASAEAEAARLVLQRDQSLVNQGVVARQELEASRARSLAADASARAARAQVAAAGSPDAQGRTKISSPVTGVVGAVQATPGGFVNAGDIVANVSDPTQSELVFTAPPALVTQVSPGMRIEVTGPSGNFEATVIGAAADVREQSGVAIIRARAEAADLPPAGSPVAGVVVATDKTDVMTVPADAVQAVEGRSVVFVAGAEGFRAVPVLAGRRAGGHVEILNGLSGNERIASSNAFLLKAELAKGEAEHGH
ncbi:MAG: efflux RND transporter periplasmic adaptor subunit [Thauera sp.]|nr:efflux RND transporter periplasmic adaptor subunit [Thauera sp.]